MVYADVKDIILQVVREIKNDFNYDALISGGTSAQEAMLKGVPVVTCRTGDVYANCHDDFAVDDYDEMINVIERYVNDIDYYKEQSEKARRLGKLEHDTIGEFSRIIEECQKRDDDNYFRNTGVYPD
jgi:predicted glycosyltransferase